MVRTNHNYTMYTHNIIFYNPLNWCWQKKSWKKKKYYLALIVDIKYCFKYVGSMEFDDHDEEIFRRYLTFCGIGIQNAQLFELSVQEYSRNQILLNLARSIFEEQNNLECLVTKIMTEARELLKCERCSVYLVDLECCESVSLVRLAL